MMEINFYMSRPKGHYGTGKNKSVLKPSSPEWHSGRPDLDNLTKFIQDALNKVFYSDDSLIAQLVCRKLYSEKPRTEIFISSLL
jgi:crossover junction endodeoxyribonuclease RusA